ncbi:class I SAM-dependent methyltransferase [Erwinia amylovora]
MRIDGTKGAKVYTPVTLKLYDWWVLSLSNRFAWRCQTQGFLVPHFRRHLGENHLDVGVGTGYYLEKLHPYLQEVTLLDLNAASLTSAARRIDPSRLMNCLQHDVFQPLPPELHHRYDSVSLFYLLHCLPGDMATKAAAIGNIKAAVTQNGTLYGATILGYGVSHNAFGRKLMAIYNRKGIFSNTQDSLSELEAMLHQHFREVEVSLQGTVALFAARDKIADALQDAVEN